MQPPIRLAILECDTPLTNTKVHYGSYGGVFTALLRAGARSLGRPDPESGLQITRHQIEQHPDRYPDLADIDAVLITGSSMLFAPVATHPPQKSPEGIKRNETQIA